MSDAGLTVRAEMDGNRFAPVGGVKWSRRREAASQLATAGFDHRVHARLTELVRWARPPPAAKRDRKSDRVSSLPTDLRRRACLIGAVAVPQDNTFDHVCEEPPYGDAEALRVCCPKTKFGENEIGLCLTRP